MADFKTALGNAIQSLLALRSEINKYEEIEAKNKILERENKALIKSGGKVLAPQAETPAQAPKTLAEKAAAGVVPPPPKGMPKTPTLAEMTAQAAQVTKGTPKSVVKKAGGKGK